MTARQPAPGATAKGALLAAVERVDDHAPLSGLLALQREVEAWITQTTDRVVDTWPVVEEAELWPENTPRGGAR